MKGETSQMGYVSIEGKLDEALNHTSERGYSQGWENLTFLVFMVSKN